jgi:hypothetical protein
LRRRVLRQGRTQHCQQKGNARKSRKTVHFASFTTAGLEGD